MNPPTETILPRPLWRGGGVLTWSCFCIGPFGDTGRTRILSDAEGRVTFMWYDVLRFYSVSLGEKALQFSCHSVLFFLEVEVKPEGEHRLVWQWSTNTLVNVYHVRVHPLYSRDSWRWVEDRRGLLRRGSDYHRRPKMKEDTCFFCWPPWTCIS